MRRLSHALLCLCLAVSLFAGPAIAHGFGSRFEISIPQSLLYLGGVGVVVVSFAIVSLFAGTERGRFSYRSRRLAATPLAVVDSLPVVRVARIVSVGLLGLGLLSGVAGPSDFNENLLTNLVWVGWWVGYTFSVIFLGNTWPVINPWKVSYAWVEGLLGRDPSLKRDYRLGSLPIVIMFLAFAWLEILAPISESPRWLAAAVLGYSIYLWGGMVVYGPDPWLQHADPFTRLYAYLGKFAPLSRVNGGEVRMYGVGLVPEEDTLYTAGGLVFLVAVLYSVTFDGFIATPEWRTIAQSAPQLPIDTGTSTVLLVLGLGLFVGGYVTIAWLITLAAGDQADALTVARRFGLSLLPIAIAYQVSHFYTFVLTQGQHLVLAIVDPFGLGWTVPGLAGYEPTTELPFLSVQFVWQSQVALIVLGHVVAVWVAHHIALEIYPDRWRAIKSQLPMIGLMVVYTMLSLWILSRPVLEPVVP